MRIFSWWTAIVPVLAIVVLAMGACIWRCSARICSCPSIRSSTLLKVRHGQ